jgi:hypothetical protein
MPPDIPTCISLAIRDRRLTVPADDIGRRSLSHVKEESQENSDK